MPRPHPPEFRRGRWSWPGSGPSRSREIAKDLGISESCLRRWIDLADVDAGRREG